MPWDIQYTNTFQKNFRKLPREIQEAFFDAFELFQEDIYDPILKTHKLRGSMSGLLASSIDTEYRFITRIHEKEKRILLFNI